VSFTTLRVRRQREWGVVLIVITKITIIGIVDVFITLIVMAQRGSSVTQLRRCHGSCAKCGYTTLVVLMKCVHHGCCVLREV